MLEKVPPLGFSQAQTLGGIYSVLSLMMRAPGESLTPQTGHSTVKARAWFPLHSPACSVGPFRCLALVLLPFFHLLSLSFFFVSVSSLFFLLLPFSLSFLFLSFPLLFFLLFFSFF